MKIKILSFVLVALLTTGCGGMAEVNAGGPSPIQSTSSGSFTARGTLKVIGERLFTSASWTCNGITGEYMYAVIVRTYSLGYEVWAVSPGNSDLKAECGAGGAAGREYENSENLLYLPSNGSRYSVWHIHLPYSKPTEGIVLSEKDRVGNEVPLEVQ